MSLAPIKILGTGKYLPSLKVTSEDLDKKLNLPQGTIYQQTKINHRFNASKKETTLYMGTQAIKQALEKANLQKKSLDLIISAAIMGEQPIPCNAVLLQKSLGLEDSGIPCFDVNSTCLSFVTAFDIASQFLLSGQYKKIAIISAEVPSKGLNWDSLENGAPLFGDGAAAAILTRHEGAEPSGILATLSQTYSSGSHLCEIKAGGTRYNPRTPPEKFEDYLFKMDGKGIYSFAAEKLTPFLKSLLAKAKITPNDIDVVIPHQAGALALKYMKKRMGIHEDKFIDILNTHGNQVSVSTPTALHEAIEQNKLQRGQTALLICTAAGLSLGGIIIRY